jgi:hypothetical protein
MSRAAKKSELQLLLDRVEQFQKTRFPDQTAQSKLKHLRKEVTEWLNNITDESEMADVFILTIATAAKLGFTANNIIAIAHRKMEVNERREWHAPDAHGICRHKEEK